LKKIGIVGLGTVGGGFYELAKNRRALNVHKVLNRSERKYHIHNVPRQQIAKDVDDLISEVDIVVETIGGMDFAYELIKKAIKSGKDVVTANKALMAAKGVEILNLAKKNGRKILFGASVGGGMPALRNVKYHSYGKISKIYGILNATSNFVLSRINEGMSMSEAIKSAQREGYAEQDPSDDINGMDAARKACIIYGMISGKIPRLEKISINSINVKSEKFEYAKRLQSVVKPIIYISFENGGAKMFVGPVAIPKYSRIAKTDETENCLVIEGESGVNFLSGIGAGQNPTAFAIMADVFSIINDENMNIEFDSYEESKIDVPSFDEFSGLKIFRPSI
jgi:homoserine dehydrogenase